MGQRTQVLQVIKTDLPQLGENQLISTQFMHNQWGFGKIMPLLLIGQLTRIYSSRLQLMGKQDDDSYNKNVSQIFDSVCTNLKIAAGKTSDYSLVYDWGDEAVEEEKKAIDEILDATYDELPKVINKFGDNNDGYMIMVFTIRPHPKYDFLLDMNIECAFITASYGDDEPAKYLTANQYMQSFIDADDGNDRYNIGNVMVALDNIATLFDDDWENSEAQWANAPKFFGTNTLEKLKPFKTFMPSLIKENEKESA